MRFTYRRTEEEDARIVPYNAALLNAWGRHLNVQLITGTSMDRYGTKYISKAEPELFAALAQGENRFQRYLKLRVVSLCEVAAHLAGFHPVQGTREVINVNTGPDDEMWRALKRKKDLHAMATEGNNGKVTLPTARDKYCERPDDLEDLTIVQFTEQYEVFLRFETIPVSRREDAAHDHAGRWVARRNKEVMARWQYLLPEDGERFYLQQLILKVPFWSTDFLSPGNVSRTLKEECILRGIVEQGEDAEQDLKRQIESDYGIPGTKRAAKKLAAKVLNGEDLDEMDGINGDGERTGPGALGLDQFTSEISEAGMETEQLRKIWNPIVREMVAMNQKLKQKGKLTASQARVLAHVTEHLARREQILGAVTGPGGTGKSFLISIIEAVATLESQLNVVLLAPAGSPAFQLKGQTVHSFLKLDIHLKCRLVAGTEAAEEVRLGDLFIIDEMSMLSAGLLEAFHGVVSDLSATPAVPFGGKSVILLGDFFQLPAIGGAPAYHSALFPLFTRFTLHEIVRQESDPDFAQVLGKVRLGVVDEQVTTCLQERVWRGPHPRRGVPVQSGPAGCRHHLPPG